MATKMSSKYKDFISKSIKSPSGSLTVHQLKPKVEKFGTLTRMTIGDKNPRKMRRTILVIGETGTGKSTLINALVNYTMGVKFEDEVWFQIVEEENGGQPESQTQSQTSEVILYEVFGDETLTFSLTIIDTPGFGDTRGIERDALVSQRLFDLFRSEDGVHEIHAVGLVLKASENRVTDRMMYIFDSVTSLFGKDVEKSLVALITHSNGRTPKNALQALEKANINLPKNAKNQPIHFLFDNCQNEDRAEDEESVKYAFDVSQKGMREFIAFLGTRQPQKLQKSIAVLNERIRLTACIQNLQDRIELTELKQAEIKETEAALRKYEEEMKRNEHFTIEVGEVYKDTEKITSGKWGLGFFFEGAVCCTECEENCHHPGCTMALTPRSCEVMSGGCCTVCSGRCPVSSHVKEDWIYVNKTRTVQKTKQDVRDKYEKNKLEKWNMSNLLEKLGKETEELSAEMWRLVDEAYRHVVELEKIALNVKSVSTYVHLDFLIKMMKRKGDAVKIQRLEDIKRRMDGENQSAIQYVWGKLKNLMRR